MAKRLFVGNLPYETTNTQLEELFSQAGKVESVNVITDRYSGRGKGFAFVEMTTEEEAQKAIQTLNGYSLDGRNIIVNEARPSEQRQGPRDFNQDRRGPRQNNRNRPSRSRY
ncbi:MAG: RNA-binding protein [bacterium]|nr:RNA-binding protein [bacterium]